MTAAADKTYVASIDLAGAEPLERPYMKIYVAAADDADAERRAALAIERGEVVRGVELLQPILDAVIDGARAGRRYSLTWKDEGRAGPVTITDLDAYEAAVPARPDGSRVAAVPFGSDPDWTTTLPWMRRADARRLAKYLGLELEEA